MSYTLSRLYDDLMEVTSVKQTEAFDRVEGFLPAQESSHTIKVAYR